MAVCIGESHTITLDDDGNVWTFGDNSHGRLGISVDTPDSEIPIQLDIPISIVDISCGFEFSVCVDIEGCVWSFGKNYGQFDTIGNSDSPMKVPNLQNIRSSSCGAKCALFIDTEHNVFSFGYNRSGELGNTNVNNTFPPHQVKDAIDIKQIANGNYHTIFLNLSGELFGCGSNGFKQLGNTPSDLINGYIKLDMPSGIKKVSCGGFHTLLLTEENDVITYGSNTCGKSGICTSIKYAKAGRPQFPDGIDIINISGGIDHSAAVDLNGNLWSFGCNISENLEMQNFVYLDSPKQVPLPTSSPVVTLSSHGCGIIVKTLDESVYTICMGKAITGNLSENSHTIGFAREYLPNRHKSARK